MRDSPLLIQIFDEQDRPVLSGFCKSVTMTDNDCIQYVLTRIRTYAKPLSAPKEGVKLSDLITDPMK